jgi:mannose-1-phosphate guanylyltransferase
MRLSELSTDLESIRPRKSTDMINVHHASIRCGIVLAAGDGQRLQSFIQRLRGDCLPKQYVNFVGSRSMLQNTFYRAEKLIPTERLFTVVSRDHLIHLEVRRQLFSRAAGTVVIQPVNKETGPGVLLPLMHVYKRYPESAVAVFPSDHFIVEEDLFMDHVELAFSAVQRSPSCLVLLGIQPREPEPEYGYIVPGREAHPGVWEVSQFVEKPAPHAALKLIEQGGLWNTMVIVFKVKTLLDLVCRAAPEMYRLFEQVLQAIGTAEEPDAVNNVYQRLSALNFSKGLLETFVADSTSRLMVLAVRGVRWSDWGSERRITTALQSGVLDVQTKQFEIRRKFYED